MSGKLLAKDILNLIEYYYKHKGSNPDAVLNTIRTRCRRFLGKHYTHDADGASMVFFEREGD
jgi:hypothetical protein